MDFYMVFLVIFILGAVVLGAGVMLSPAWLTSQPRIALAGTLALALVIGGAVFWAYLFGWDTLVVDYMLFALVVSIFLGGTLSVGQSRAEKRGEVLLDEEQGWTGPEDLLFFAAVALLFIIPVVFFNMPFGNPIYAYMGVAAKLGGTFNTFAPFEPGATFWYPPGFSAISAYLSQQLNTSIQPAQAGIGAVVAYLCVWLVYDFGAEVQDKRLGRAMAAAMLVGLGLLNTFLRAEFPALIGVLFALAFLIYAYRYHRDGHLIDLIAGGLLLGAVLLVHLTVFITTLAGYLIWLVISNFGDRKAPPRRLLMMALGIPAVMLLATSPYLVRTGIPTVTDFERSLYATGINRIGDIFNYHGLWIWIAAGTGLYLGVRQRRQITLLAISLLVAGVVAYGLNAGSYLLILPLTLLAGPGLLWLWEDVILPRLPILKQGRVYTLGAMAALIGVWAITSVLFLRPEALSTSPFTPDELAALDWYRKNTEPGIRMGNDESEDDLWIPVLSERSARNTPYTPYFLSTVPEGTVRLSGGIWGVEYPFYRGEGDDPLASNPAYERLFESGNVRIYRLK
jgi:hypothetical protein